MAPAHAHARTHARKHCLTHHAAKNVEMMSSALETVLGSRESSSFAAAVLVQHDFRMRKYSSIKLLRREIAISGNLSLIHI